MEGKEMNQEITNSAIIAFNELISSSVALKTFCVDQAPDVIQQLLHYKFYICSLGLIFDLLFIVIGIVFLKNKT